MTKAAAKSGGKVKIEKIEKAELFAEAYVKNLGNGTMAAKEVFDCDSENTAAVMASEYLRKPQVQEIVSKYLEIRRASFKKMVEQTDFYMTEIVTVLLEMVKDKDLSFHERLKAIDKLSRFAGADLSEEVKIKQIEAKESAAARGRALIPGLSAPGIQPGQPTAGLIDNSRKTIFMLSPPPMPPGGVPTPALLEQWKEAGWIPGIESISPVVDTPVHGPSVRTDRGATDQ